MIKLKTDTDEEKVMRGICDELNTIGIKTTLRQTHRNSHDIWEIIVNRFPFSNFYISLEVPATLHITYYSIEKGIQIWHTSNVAVISLADPNSNWFYDYFRELKVVVDKYNQYFVEKKK